MAQSPDRNSAGNKGPDKSQGSAAKKPPKTSPGVRGPGGPPPAPASRSASPGRAGSSRPTPGAPSGTTSSLRHTFEARSLPLVTFMSRIPRWIVVVLPAVLLLFGLIQTGSLAWLGGVLLILVWLLLAWLTALSWPAITAGSRLLRVIVLLALLGIIAMKFMGRL